MNELLALFEGIAANLQEICQHTREFQLTLERLERIEELLAASQSGEIKKPFVTPKELANLTTEHGAIEYSYFSIRQACNHGRIEGAFKQPYNKQWLIPKDSVELILSEGLPPD